MTNILKTLFYISVCISVCGSCKSDAPITEDDNHLAYGSWLLSEAVKDGRLTKTLEGAKFSIDSSSFSTNLFGEDQLFGYKRIGDKIKLSGSQEQLFTVNKSTLDTLILTMKRRKTQYQLLLIKPDSTVVN